MNQTSEADAWYDENDQSRELQVVVDTTLMPSLVGLAKISVYLTTSD